jgi:hypothetical protein
MGKLYEAIADRERDFIARQQMFFVATAAPDSRVNLSPKGMDSLRVLSSNRVIWLNLTGSGNETAAHLLEDDRITLMFCAFEGDAQILRLYGHARAIHRHDPQWDELSAHFSGIPGARQVIDVSVDLVQTSCGFGVPLYDYQGQRDGLFRWAEKKGEQGVRQYWEEKNALSLDGRPTGVVDTPD